MRRAEEFRRYCPRKSSSAPPIRSVRAVARQCWPTACEVLGLDVETPAVLADRALEGEAPVHVDRVRGASQEGLRQSAVEGRELRRQDRSRRGHELARVAADDRPLAGLAFGLHDVDPVVVGRRVGRPEVAGLALQREPPQRPGHVAADHPHGRKGVRHFESECDWVHAHLAGGEVVIPVVRRERVLEARSDMVPADAKPEAASGTPIPRRRPARRRPLAAGFRVAPPRRPTGTSDRR